MPKVTDKKKGAAKGKRARKSRKVAEDEGQHSNNQEPQEPQDTQSDPQVSDAESTTSLDGIITDEQEEQIAQFFEDRPFFYDKGDTRYKNTRAKDAELFEFSKEVGLDREYQIILTIFISLFAKWYSLELQSIILFFITDLL